jgi:hypothetical protein
MNTSLCTRGTPGSTLPSSAIKANPPGGVHAVAGVQGAVDPTIEGTCMRRPALTRRTSMLPETGVVAAPVSAGNNEAEACVLSNATPLNR